MKSKDIDLVVQERYRDDYDPKKGYTQLLAVAGMVPQAREITQMQTIQLDLLKRLGDTLLKDGSVVSGMSYVKVDNTITVTEGKVYLNGIIHNFAEQSVEITGEGEEAVCVRLNSEIITEVQDPSLRDPHHSFANYGKPGAHRRKETVELVANDPESPAVYEFIDGVLKNDPIRPQLDAVIDLLAGRTYDEIGNYKVEGLEVWAEDRNENTIAVIVEPGKAYVRGYEVSRPLPSRVILPRVKNSRKVFNEPKTYKTSLLRYYFNNNPVADIQKLVGTVEVTNNIIRGSVTDGIDSLPLKPVVSITKIEQNGTVYKEGVDFQLTSDGVDWSLAKAQPSIGTTYQVTYRYNKILEKNKDYVLSTETKDEVTLYYISFKSGGDKPVDGTVMHFDYEYYLGRLDLIVIDQKGNVSIVPGQADKLDKARAPIHQDHNTLQLGILTQAPYGGSPKARTQSIEKLHMRDLQDIVERVKDMEYNQALSALDQETLNAESGTELKGIFSDSFATTMRGDLGHPDFSVAYDLINAQIELQIKSSSEGNPDIDEDTSKVAVWGRLVTAPYTETEGLVQPYATDRMLINPYNVFTQMGTLKLDPSVDNWVDEELIIEGNKTTNKTVTVNTITSGRQQFPDIDFSMGDRWSGGWRQYHGNNTSITTRTILEEAITYMRQTEVTIYADSLIPASDNLELTFDGQVVPLTPINGTPAGTKAGTVRSTLKGIVEAKFTVPEGVRTGTREVILSNKYNNAASSYTANGTRKVTGQSVLTTKVTLNVIDPLAQSFGFDQDRILSSVGIYFAEKDISHNVLVQVRDMVSGGLPGQLVYGEAVLRPSDIKVSEKGTEETRVHFNTPILCEGRKQYALVLLTDSDDYSVFIASIGEPDLESGAFVTKNPYNDGVLFSSSNSFTWTPHHKSDLKFTAYTAKFDKKGILEFDPITDVEMDKIVLLADQLTPGNTGCEWEFRTVENGQYLPIISYEGLDLNELVKFVQLRAIFEATDHMSPILAIDSFNLMSFLTEKSGNYISRTTELDQAYTDVKMVFEAKIPSGCTVTPSFSYDGKTWLPLTLEESRPITKDFTQFTYTAKVDPVKDARVYKVKIALTAPNSLSRPAVRRLMNVVK